MKATEARLLEFLKKSPQFVIPIYQRTYSWSEKECLQLWNDIIRTGKNDDISAHFVGSIVYVEKDLYSVSSQSSLLVIDGQQRLTTVTLLIEAIARATGDTEPVEGFSAKKLRSYYLLNPLEDGERRYKLLLSQTDKTTLLALLDYMAEPKDVSIRIKGNFEFFTDRISKNPDVLPLLCQGLAKLVLVDISLSRGQDNPQLIFESLNSTGRELSQADLIRNYILMGLEPDLQTRMYQHYWRSMELDFGQEAYASSFDSYMRHYLTVRTGDIPNKAEVYEAFKSYACQGGVEHEPVEKLLSDVHKFSKYYCAMAFGQETVPQLREVFQDIRELKVDVAMPLMLELYNDYATSVISQEEFRQILRWIESYVFRRAVCGIPTNSMNKTFATFSKSIRKDNYLESVAAHFQLMPSYRRFPSEEEFRKEILTRDLYNFRNRTYLLRRLENSDSKERVAIDEYSIEHILPQNENLSERWKADLGPEWSRIQKEYLHTLGNLTLTGYNSELSDRSFLEKRDIKGGFSDSPLRINKGLRQLDVWTESAIQERGFQLASIAVKVWGQPGLSQDILKNYVKVPVSSSYTIDQHPYLTKAPMQKLFEELRKQITALDPCISEEFMKLYVAYKAETNFVDVIPQAKRMLLMLNMHFTEINDPKGLCRDVTGMGRWGNGDVEIAYDDIGQLPYIMGLIRQSLERQMDRVPND